MSYVRVSERSLNSEPVPLTPFPLGKGLPAINFKGPFLVLQMIAGAVQRLFASENTTGAPATVIEGPWQGSAGVAINLHQSSATTPEIVPLWVDFSTLDKPPSEHAKALLDSFNKSVSTALEDHLKSGRVEGIYENGQLVDVRLKR